MLTEIVVALGILTVALIPISFSFANEQREFRSYYYRALAMELVDGEMEILRAGEWTNFSNGSQAYPVHGAAANNLPPGRFVLIRENRRLSLEWLPEEKNDGGKVRRECYVD